MGGKSCQTDGPRRPTTRTNGTGNRTRRTDDTTGESTEYDWDFRNRLVAVRELDDQDNVVFEVNYTYDVFDRRIAKSVDSDGAGSSAAVATYFVYDGEHILLEFDDGGDLTQRYLHGPVIDQILAAEDVTSLSSAGDVVWPLADNQGTIRDLIDSTGTVLNHLKYNAFGQITSESNSAVDFLFAYTGRERDEETGLYYYRARYYDPAVGRFVSEDPIGFLAGDVNVSRYVGNGPANLVDPTGMMPPEFSRPHQKPRDVPTGTLPIDKHPDTKDIVEDLKPKLGPGVGPRTWVGISPDDHVIVPDANGNAEDLGPWKDYYFSKEFGEDRSRSPWNGGNWKLQKPPSARQGQPYLIPGFVPNPFYFWPPNPLPAPEPPAIPTPKASPGVRPAFPSPYFFLPIIVIPPWMQPLDPWDSRQIIG